MLIENATVVTVDAADRVLDRAWIAITDGAITAVSAEPIAPRPGEPRLDATGKVVMPGLINAHTHLFQVLIRGVYEELPFVEWLRRIYACGLALTEEDAYLSARSAAVEALTSGTTTIVEHHFLNRVRDLPAATIDGMRSMGVRTVFARTAMDMGALAPSQVLEAPDEAVAACEALLASYQAAVADPARMLSVFVGPNTPGVSATAAMARAMTDLAQARGLRQSLHLAESRSVVRQVERDHGITGVARWLDAEGALRGPILAAHSVHLDVDELRLLAERDVAISHNPVSNMFLGDGIAPVWEALEQKVVVALGTDGAASNNSQDMFEVMKVAPLLQRARREDASAVGPRQALRMATIDGARALGLGDVIGSIEVGKRADLVVLDLEASPHTVAVHDVVSQLVHCAPSDAVSSVLVDGRLIVNEGRVAGIDQQALLADAQAAGMDLVRRLSVIV